MLRIGIDTGLAALTLSDAASRPLIARNAVASAIAGHRPHADARDFGHLGIRDSAKQMGMHGNETIFGTRPDGGPGLRRCIRRCVRRATCSATHVGPAKFHCKLSSAYSQVLGKVTQRHLVFECDRLFQPCRTISACGCHVHLTLIFNIDASAFTKR